MSEETRKIFIEGKPVDAVKDDQKLASFFEQFDDNIFRVADKKFAAMCKKHDLKATMTILIRFEEE